MPWRLERYGLRWLHAPAVLAHALDDGRSAVLHHDVDATAAGLDGWADGDGDAWRRMLDGYRRLRDPLLDALFTPIPPVRALARILARTRTAGALEIARLAALPVRRLGQETFRGEGGGLLLTGNALHADIPPDAAGSGLYGWLLAMLGQDVGFPVPEGGAGRLAEAMRRRFEAVGGEVVTGAEVTHVEVRAGRAVGVRTAGGLEVGVRRAVLADVSAPALFGRLLHQRDVPAALRRRMETFQWDYSTFKAGLGAGRAGAVDRRRCPRCRHGAPRGRRPRVRPDGCRPVDGPHPGAAVPAVRPDDHVRPEPLAGRDRVRVGVHPRAARHHVGRGGGRRAGAAGRGGRRAGGAGVQVPDRGALRAEPDGHRGRRRQPGGRCDQRRHGLDPPATWCSGPPPGWVGRRRR